MKILVTDGLRELVKYPQQAVPTVAQITGRPGLTFEQWARRNVAMFR
jgi:hypothetical protein